LRRGISRSISTTTIFVEDSIMLRRFTFTALAMALGLTAGACSEQATPTAESELAAMPQMDASAGRVVASVRGAWSIPGERTIAFNAREYADGTVGGKWERVNHVKDPVNGPVNTAHNGDVVCITILEALIAGSKEARIGTITTNGPQAGQEGGFRVIDNGEGANAVPDQASRQIIGGGPGYASNYCATGTPTLALNDVGAGNVQIREDRFR
jgi:hypothetical protein